MDDDALFRGFCERTLTHAEWTHRAHLRVAWMYLARWPSVDEAHLRMRVGIVRLNAAHGLEETPTRGYHETLTRVWLVLVAHARGLDAADDSITFLDRHGELLEREAPLRHYSRERLFAIEARAVFTPPDRAPLPLPRAMPHDRHRSRRVDARGGPRYDGSAMAKLDRTTTSAQLQLRSLVKAGGELEVSLAEVEIPRPGPDEVLVRVEAAPVNPSDLLLLFGLADLTTVKSSGTAERPIITATIPEASRTLVAPREGQSMPVGNEGAGVVVEAGTSAQAQALLGKTVAAGAGAMYAQYRCVRADQCIALPAGVSAIDGAAAFVNPLTALTMLETMRAEGHTALVHTAAASSLGQMLQRLCTKDGVALVNVVRKHEQAAILRALGAKYVCDSTSPTFLEDLTNALAETRATIGFDAIGGGRLASQILGCMEAAINRSTKEYSRYGSSTHKQVYVYGSLDPRPTELVRTFGLAWGLGGWLVTPALMKLGLPTMLKLRARVAAEITTTFATTYAKHVSLAGLLDPEAIAAYGSRSTGGKYLVRP